MRGLAEPADDPGRGDRLPRASPSCTSRRRCSGPTRPRSSSRCACGTSPAGCTASGSSAARRRGPSRSCSTCTAARSSRSLRARTAAWCRRSLPAPVVRCSAWTTGWRRSTASRPRRTTYSAPTRGCSPQGCPPHGSWSRATRRAATSRSGLTPRAVRAGLPAPAAVVGDLAAGRPVDGPGRDLGGSARPPGLVHRRRAGHDRPLPATGAPRPPRAAAHQRRPLGDAARADPGQRVRAAGSRCRGVRRSDARGRWRHDPADLEGQARTSSRSRFRVSRTASEALDDLAAFVLRTADTSPKDTQDR